MLLFCSVILIMPTYNFSGRVERSVDCVCLCLRTITFQQNDLRPIYLVWWFILTICRSSSKVKDVGQSSRLQDEKMFPFTSRSESEIWDISDGALPGRVANPRPVATIKTGRVRIRLRLVARRDRSWLWRLVLDLQRAQRLLEEVLPPIIFERAPG